MSHHAQKWLLLQRLRELGVRVSSIEEALQAPHSKDWEDMAVEREDEEVLERLGAASAAEIARIRAALQRMADGEYGVCQKCGGAISSARLTAVPDAMVCVDCAWST